MEMKQQETGQGYANEEQGWRSQMNWGQNQDCLSNYQKIGRFRRNHIAIGAGQHEKLADSPYTFSRTYTGKATVGAETKTDYEDKVVVALPGSEGTYDVSVGTVFEDGATVVDEYSGEEYTVSGGKVAGVKCDGNGVILLAEPAVSTPKAKIMSSVSKGKESGGVYNTDSLTLKLSTQNVKDASYQINECEPVSFSESTEVTIGEDTAYEEKTKITIKGTSEIDGEVVSKEFTYSRGKEPTIGEASEGFYIRMSKAAYEKESGSKSAPYIWVYDSKGSYSGEAWKSRDTMTLDASGEYYEWKKESLTTKVNVIITETVAGNETDCWRSVPDMKNGGMVGGTLEIDPSKEYTDSEQIKEIVLATGEPCKVTVEYLDGSGKAIKTITRVGAEGDAYTVYAPKSLSTVPGSKLAEGEKTSVKGTFAKDEKTIQFKYSVNGEVVQTEPPVTEPPKTEPPVTEPPKTETPATEAPKTETPATEAPKTEAPATEAPKTEAPVTEAPKTEAPATEAPKTEAPATEAPKTEAPATETPKTEAPATPTPVPTVPSTPTPMPATPTPEPVFDVTISASKKSVVAGKSVKLTAKASGGNGSYTYKFTTEKGSSVSTIRNYTKTSTFNWTPAKAGTYTVVVYAKDTKTGNITTDEITIKVTPAPLVVTMFKVLNLGKLRVQLKANATGGKGALKYKYTYTYKGKTRIIKNYSGIKSFKKVMSKPGNLYI